MEEYQLREKDSNGEDTGALLYFSTLEEAFQEFLSGRYWKLSFQLPDSRRVRLLMGDDNRTITVTYFSNVVQAAINEALASAVPQA